MAVRVITSTELRFRAADMVKGLRKGDSFVIVHYREPVAFVTPEIPKQVIERMMPSTKKTESKDFEVID